MGDYLGKFEGRPVYQIFSEDGMKDDECFYVYKGGLYFRYRIVGAVRNGRVFDWNEARYVEVLRDTSWKVKEEKIKVKPAESPVCEDEGEVDALLSHSRKTIEELLGGFKLSANEYLEEVKNVD